MRSFNYEKYLYCRWNNEVCGLLEEINDMNGRLSMFMTMRQNKIGKLEKHARFGNIIASNKIEGICADRAVQVCGNVRPRTEDEALIAGYSVAYDRIMSSERYPLDNGLICELHGMMYRYADDGGRFKKEPNVIVAIRPDGTRRVLFEPLAPEYVEAALSELCDGFCRALEMRVVSPLLLIPLFVSDFLCIHPFEDGNGRMSRLLAEYLLLKAGYPVARYSPLDKFIEKSSAWYYKSLAENNEGWHDGKNDALAFVVYFLCVVRNAYSELMWQIGHIGVPARDAVADRFSETGGWFDDDLSELFPLLKGPSVTREIARLLQNGELLSRSDGSRTIYFKN